MPLPEGVQWIGIPPSAAGHGPEGSGEPRRAVTGIFDVRHSPDGPLIDIQRRNIALDDRWDFYWRQFVPPAAFDARIARILLALGAAFRLFVVRSHQFPRARLLSRRHRFSIDRHRRRIAVGCASAPGRGAGCFGRGRRRHRHPRHFVLLGCFRRPGARARVGLGMVGAYSFVLSKKAFG